MSVVTRLVAGKRNPNRVNVYLDDKFAFALSLDEVVKRGLTKGTDLKEQDIGELLQNDLEDRMYMKALNYLSYRPRSTKEVHDKLYKYGLRDKAVIKRVVSRLQANGHLDDESFARWFTESRSTHRPRSARHLAAELSQKGVDRDVINMVVRAENNDEGAIQQLIAKKSSLSREKLIAYLARRGFTFDLIRRELDKIIPSE
jgi:regulatory protein